MLLIRLIGQVEIEPNHAGPLSRGAKEVLAYLVLNRSSSRSRLAGAIWPESDESSALYNLRRALTDLRRHLGEEADRLDSSDRGTLGLDLGGVQVDLFSIRAAFASGSYGEMVGRCSGSPLDGVSGEWAAPFRDAIRTELTLGLVTAARYAAGLNGVADAEAFLRAALVQSRHPESVWQGLVRLHTEAGDVAAARKILAECEASLIGEPEASIRPAAGLSKSVHLAGPPPVLGNLVGRHEILTQLSSDLREFRIVTLCGTGGMGKTRVATALAHRLADDYVDGVAFVELVGATTSAGVKEAIARGLGIRVDQGSPWTQVIEWLSRRRVLLVLDNAEHIVGLVAEVVTELLSRTSQLRLLVTSRVPLGLPIERRRRLPTLRPSDAHALFASRAVAADSEFISTEESRALCDQLDGIPLAIELTAAQVGSISLRQLSANLTRSLTLDSVCDGRPERHQTMRAALRMSFDALPPERRKAFIKLSVFVEGFSNEAAIAVAGVSLSDLTRLTTVSLIEFEGDRYRMLEPVRQLAWEEIHAGGGDQELQGLHARWFAGAAKTLYQGPFPYNIDPRRFSEDRKQLQRDHANLKAAIRYFDKIEQGMSDEALSLWLIVIWYRLIEHSEPAAQAWMGKLTAQPTEATLSWIAAQWWLTVGLYSIWNDFEEAAVPLLERLGGACVRSGYLDVYGHLAQALGSRSVHDPSDGAIRRGYEVSIRTFEGLKDANELRHARAQCFAWRSAAGEIEEFWPEVERLAAESLAQNDVRCQAILLRLLAQRETTWTDRQAILRKVVRIQRSVGHWAEVHTLRSIGMGARDLGTAEDEIEAWTEAIRRGEEIGWVNTLSEAHLELARAYLRGGQEPSMWVSMARSLQMIRAQDRPGFLHLALVHLADLLRISGDRSGCDEILGYLRRAANADIYAIRPKFEELHPGFSNPDFVAGTGMFTTSDDIIGWVEIRAMLGSGDSATLDVPVYRRKGTMG